MGYHLKALIKAESHAKVTDVVGRRFWFLFSALLDCFQDGGS